MCCVTRNRPENPNQDSIPSVFTTTWFISSLFLLRFFFYLRSTSRSSGLLCWHRHSRKLGRPAGSGRAWVDPTVDARGTFPLEPSFNVVLAVTQDPTTRTEPTNHAGYDTEDCDHREDGYYGSNRPVTGMSRAGLLGHG